MASVTFGDELVRDYLVYRGFLSALKVFDSEVKADKDRGFRPDRIVEHLSSCITNLDLNGLREAWSHLEDRVYSRLEHSFLSHARKLENALLRMYLVTCISAGRHDKLLDFFEKMTSELQGQSEWKEWFAMPFLKNPDENPSFSVYFTRHWQDTMLVSLYNFVSVVFQSIATPSLLSYEEELFRLNTLQEENDILKARLASVGSSDTEVTRNLANNDIQDIVSQSELMDDFYVIAQETPTENVGRSIKTLIKSISSGLPASPILGRHIQETRRQDDLSPSGGMKAGKTKPRSPSVPPQPSSQICSESTTSRNVKQEVGPASRGSLQKESDGKRDIFNKYKGDHSNQHTVKPLLTDPKCGFLILSQEDYSGHNSFITHCQFNSTGSCVASSDTDDFIKIWSSPSLQTFTTIMSRHGIRALEWAAKKERLLLYGNGTGEVRLYDTRDRRVVGEVTQNSVPTENQKVMCISCNPTEVNFAVSVECDPTGCVTLYDMRTQQMQHSIPFSFKNCCCCCSFNHNGQLLLVGTQDGQSQVYDLRSYENIASWSSHAGSVLAIQFSPDENACYTMGQDGKFIQWSINQTGHELGELGIHAGATGLPNEVNQPIGKLFAFNNDANHVLTCGPVGGVIYKVAGSTLNHSLNIGGYPVTTVDWSTAMECSTCLCGSANGKITVTTLMAQ